MPNKSISQLDPGAAVAAGNLVPVVQTVGVGPVKITASAFGDYFLKGSYTNNTLVYDSVNSRIGIGTTSPAQLLDVQGASNPLVKIKSTGGVIGNYAGVLFDSYNTFNGTGQAYIYGISSATGNSNTDLSFGVNASGFGSPFEAMRINSTGNVGIGSTNPTQALYIQRAGAVAVQIVNSANSINMLIGATTTEAYLSAPNGAMAFNAAGAERMRITSAGNVGIGTTSPSERLTVLSSNPTGGVIANLNNPQPTAATGAYLQYGNDGVGYWKTGIVAGVNAFAIADIINGERLRINSSGNVGIGTASPANRLSVLDSSAAAGLFYGYSVVGANANNNNGSIQIGNFSGNCGRLDYDAVSNSTGTLSLYNTFSGPLVLGTGNTERMRITSAGNVGIGTTSPGTILEASRAVSNNIGPEIRLRNDAGTFLSGSRISFYDGLYERASIVMQVEAAAATGNMQFYTGFNPSTEKMRITGAGNVGIGTTSPAGLLHIEGSSTGQAISFRAKNTNATGADKYIEMFAGGQSTGISVWNNSGVVEAAVGANLCLSAYNGTMIFQTGTSRTERMRIDSAGNVGIGTTNPSSRLHVVSSAALTANFQGPANTYVDYTDGTGTLRLQLLSNEPYIASIGAYPLRFAPNNSEAMRITSAGNVCIGATSIIAGEVMRLGYAAQNSIALGNTARNNAGFFGAFDDFALFGVNRNPSTGVVVDASKYTAQIAMLGNATDSYIIFSTSAAANVSPTERMRITSAGNVGIGVTPSAWSGLRGLQNGNASLSAASFDGYLSANVFYDGSGWKYINSGFGIQYFQDATTDGAHVWRTAASGSAGAAATLTERMRITSAGDVGIGTISPGSKLHIAGSGAIRLQVNTPSGANYFGYNGTTDALQIASKTDILFNAGASYNEAMRITSAGNLLIGTTSSPTTGTQCLTIETETAPTATPADTVTFYSSDLSAGNTMPSFYTEGTIVGTGTPTANRTIAVRINGTVYYLLASTIP